MSEIGTRLATEDEAALIYATWLRSYRYSSQFTKKISDEIYYKWHHLIIDNIAKRGGRFYVAYHIDAPEAVLGYIAVETQFGCPVVHYCYVKKPFRKRGIAKTLLAVEPDLDIAQFTHWTKHMDWIIKRLPTLTYNPYGV